MEDRLKQLKNVNAIIDGIEYYKNTILLIDMVGDSNDIVIDYMSTDGWKIHTRTFFDGSINIEACKHELKEDAPIQKIISYSLRVPETATDIQFLDKWVFWKNENKDKREVVFI